MNTLLPEDISVVSSWKAPKDFHARFSAEKKTYLYFIFTGKISPVLFRDLIWWVKEDVCLDKIKQMEDLVLGTYDFKSFQSSGSED